MTKRVLLLGCGDLGLRTARVLQARGYSVTGARRSVGQLPGDLDALALDVTNQDSFDVIQKIQWDAIIVSLTARGEAAYRQVYVEGTRNLIHALHRSSQTPYIIFVSSTSIYHQSDGEVVNEYSSTEPTGFSGLAMKDAESLLRDSGLVTSAVRFSGIYGASHGGSQARGGHLLSVLREGRIAPERPMRFSNRVHIEDCVGILSFLIDRHFSGRDVSPVYLGSDGDPANLHEVMCYLAGMENIDVEQLQTDYLPARGGNKRCQGVLLAEQGYTYRYPSYRAGYA